MWYAELILPLALDTLYHYRLEQIPEGLAPSALIGARAIVSLGPKRFYTGIIRSLTQAPPADVSPDTLKSIETLLDTSPLVPVATLRLWEWVAQYYHCTLGQVMRQALPSALMPESETMVYLTEDFEATTPLKPIELSILDELSAAPKRSLTLLQLHHRLGTTAPLAYDRLISLGAIYTEESLRQRYRPHTITILSLRECYQSEERLSEAFDSLKRAKKQQALLTDLTSLLLETAEALKGQVARQNLVHSDPNRATLLRQLIARGIVEQTDVACSRYSTTPTATIHTDQWQHLPTIEHSRSVSYLYLDHTSQRERTILSLVRQHYTAGEQVLLLSPSAQDMPSAHGLLNQLEQMTGRLYEYHASSGDNHKADLYKHLGAQTEPCVVVGTRSAVFLPLPRLGLIIVDSEEAYMYKQQHASPYFHARDVALYLGASRQIPVVLMSSTPSAEALFNILRGKYQSLTPPKTSALDLTEEHHVDLEIIDLAHERSIRRLKPSNLITDRLAELIGHQLAMGRRVLLLQNRKGYAPYLMCPTCGESVQCPRCSVSLCLHHNKRLLQCHHCGYSQVVITTCPRSSEHPTAGLPSDLPQLKPMGYGIERVEEELRELFPQAHVLRMDSDTLLTKAKARELHEAIERGHADIIVGTQLIKGQPIWDNVGLVGVLQLDQILAFPDFRAEERAYQLLYQLHQHLSTHAGAKFVLQTNDIEQDFIAQLRTMDYTSFIKSQLKMRQLFAFPPFVRLCYIRLGHSDAHLVAESAKALTYYLQSALGTDRVCGPIEPSIARIDLRYIQQIICKRPYSESFLAERQAFQQAMQQLRHFYPQSRKVQILYDVDPL